MTLSPPDRVPTLTEVVEPHTGTVHQRPEPPVLVHEVEVPQAALVASSAPIDEAAMAQRITDALQADIDRLVEARLRETLAPLLSQWIDDAGHLVRLELASTLRESVVRAVAGELARHRTEAPPR